MSHPERAPLRERLRGSSLGFAAGASVVLHLALALATQVRGCSPILTRPEITWLDLDNKLGSPTPKTASRQPVAPVHTEPATTTSAAEHSGQKVALRARHRGPDAGVPADAAGVDTGEPSDAAANPSPADAGSRALAALAPGDASLTLLLRMDRVRKSPYEAAVRRLLEVFYDYKMLLLSSGIDPINDLDALIIATPNPYRVTETFLAAKHNLPLARIRAALERGASLGERHLTWVQSPAGLLGEIPSPPRLSFDPRSVLLRENLVALTAAQHVSLLREPTAGGPDLGVAGDAGRVLSFAQRLQQMIDGGGTARTADSPGLILEAVNIPRFVRLPDGVPPPQSLTVEIVPAKDRAVMRGVIRYETAAEAKASLAALIQERARLRESFQMRVLGVAGLLDGLSLTREGNQVRAHHELPADQMSAILELLRGAIPQVEVPGMPPRPRIDAGLARDSRP